ncbi:MAG: hypothetical protein ACRD44_08040 [Bryobacteraceae bacterium]
MRIVLLALAGALAAATPAEEIRAVLERQAKDWSRGDLPAFMGRLQFSEIEVRMLGADHAVVLGRFHLTRTAAGGGDARGTSRSW